jgi:hypothetical protein
MFGLRLLNHRTDRAERILGCYLEVKRSFLFFWRRTLLRVPVRGILSEGSQPVSLRLEPLSEPTIRHVMVAETVFGPPLPKRRETYLVLEMVGPIRRLELKMPHVKYDVG